ncbi:MAG: hypothetical protein HQL88_00475 [Magnetococcales bacterium]|nr:hypothetical protein [Magnetococcales bacterium]
MEHKENKGKRKKIKKGHRRVKVVDATQVPRIAALEKQFKTLKSRIGMQLQQLSDRNEALLRRSTAFMRLSTDRHQGMVQKTEAQMKQLSDRNSALLRKTDAQLQQLSDRNAALLRKVSEQLEQLSQRNEALLRKFHALSASDTKT